MHGFLFEGCFGVGRATADVGLGDASFSTKLYDGGRGFGAIHLGHAVVNDYDLEYRLPILDEFFDTVDHKFAALKFFSLVAF